MLHAEVEGGAGEEGEEESDLVQIPSTECEIHSYLCSLPACCCSSLLLSCVSPRTFCYDLRVSI